MRGKKSRYFLEADEVARHKLFPIIVVVMLLVINGIVALSYAKEGKISIKNNQADNGISVTSKSGQKVLGEDYPTARFTWRGCKIGFITLLFVDARTSAASTGYRLVKYNWRWDDSDDSFHAGPSFNYHIYRDLGKKMHKVYLEVTDSGGKVSSLVMHLAFARPISSGTHGSFSATYITKYDNPVLPELSSYILKAQYAELKSILSNSWWPEKFCKTETSVTESTFTNEVSTSNFFYHCGHGIYDWTGDFITELTLKNWQPLPNNGDLRPQDVKNKWNNNIKWVFLHSCHILEDDTSGMPGHNTTYFRDKWAETLNDCHMILGFASVTYPSSWIISDFFQRAMGEDNNVVQAYKLATTWYLWNEVKGAVIADTYDQFNNDHLYGHGTVQPDEETEDDSYYSTTWWC